MSYREIMAAIEGYKMRQQYEAERLAVISYEQSHLLGSIIGRLLGSKTEPPSLKKAFQSVFGEEKVEQLRQQDWRIMKERIADRAAAYRKRGESNGDDIRKTTNLNNSGNKAIK